MNKLLIFVMAVMLAAGAAGGGWWYAAERGLIPGKPNSPRPENFKAALDQYLIQPAGYLQRPCANVGYSPSSPRGFPDMRFDWTPVGFRATPDARPDPQGTLKARLELLAKQGYLQSAKTEAGVEYTMTWKGYAESNGNGCFFVASAEREAKIIGFEKKRVENNVDIYEVTARPQPVKVEAWSQTQEFKDSFGAGMGRQLDPEPVTYELARGDQGFTVIGERGRQPASRSRGNEDAAMTAKLAGTLTPDRVKKAAESYLAKIGNIGGGFCLRLPVQGEADEVQPVGRAQSAIAGVAGSVVPARPGAPNIVFYNFVGRERYAMDNVLRGFETMRRLESLGLARSELLNVTEARGYPAQGGVRYELTEAAAAKVTQGYGACYSLGTLQVEEVVSFSQFSEMNLRPRFVARLSAKPADDEAKRVVEKFGHLARVAAVGVAMSGTLRYASSELQVEGAQANLPQFYPDTTGVSLPVISVTPAKPGAPQPPRGGSVQSPSISGVAPMAVPYPSISAAVPMAVPYPGMRAAAAAMDVYAIGVYEGPSGAKGATVAVNVRNSARPIALFLSSYEEVHWMVTAPGGTKVVRIVVSGYHPQRVTTPGVTGVEVLRVPYVPVNSRAPQPDLIRATVMQFGMQPISAQYSYKGGTFEVGSR